VVLYGIVDMLYSFGAILPRKKCSHPITLLCSLKACTKAQSAAKTVLRKCALVVCVSEDMEDSQLERPWTMAWVILSGVPNAFRLFRR
jgi:hypothetical protein